jgi:hypothetical protein
VGEHHDLPADVLAAEPHPQPQPPHQHHELIKIFSNCSGISLNEL